MSFISAPPQLTPLRLDQLAGRSWAGKILKVLRQHRHQFADHLCLRTIRSRLGEYLEGKVPLSLQEDLFQHGAAMLRNEAVGDPYISFDDLLTPDMFVLYMFVTYQSEIKSLEIPELSRQADRVTTLDLLYNVGTPYGHNLKTAKFRMFESPAISIEESYLTKRVLRGFRNLQSLVLWKACDDAMLQIIGITCHHLESIDLWKSINVTDQGVRMLLGLDAERRTCLCPSLKKVMVKDTAVTDEGAYSFLLHCPRLHTLEFSHGSFIKQFLNRVIESYHRNQKTFPALRSIFLPILESESLFSIIKSFPQLEELSLWTSLSHLPSVKMTDLSHVHTLKVGGLNHFSILSEISSLIGSNITTLKIETVHFDLNLDKIGNECPNIEDMSIVNARIRVTPKIPNQQISPKKIFSNLKKVYFFLVHYLHISVVPSQAPPSNSISSPTGVACPATGYTALHTLLKNGIRLENVQVTGTTALTDSCLEAILSVNPLVHLRRLVISNPSITQEHPLVVPLTSRSVNLLQKSCPLLQSLGDLRHWAVSPAASTTSHRQSFGSSSLQQTVWTKVQISSTRRMYRSSSVLYQGTAAVV